MRRRRKNPGGGTLVLLALVVAGGVIYWRQREKGSKKEPAPLPAPGPPPPTFKPSTQVTVWDLSGEPYTFPAPQETRVMDASEMGALPAQDANFVPEQRVAFVVGWPTGGAYLVGRILQDLGDGEYNVEVVPTVLGQDVAPKDPQVQDTLGKTMTIHRSTFVGSWPEGIL